MFRTMIDSDLFLPEGWSEDPKRREMARVPDAVTYRPKYDIALELLRRARSNGVRFAWVTADEWYGAISQRNDGASFGRRPSLFRLWNP